MTYIELINNFWFLDDDWQFTCCETRLYFYLLKTANRLGWVDSWARSDARVSSDVGVSVNSMKTARNRLVQAGLIAFKPGGNGQRDKTRYQVIYDFRYQNMTPNLTPNLAPNLTPNLVPKVQPYNNKTKTKTKSVGGNNSGELFPPDTPPKKSSRKKAEFIPPTHEEVKEYFRNKLPDWELQADIFFNHFSGLGWKTSAGAKVERWDSRANLWIIEKKQENGKSENQTQRPNSRDADKAAKARKLLDEYTAIEQGTDAIGNQAEIPDL